MPRGRRSRLLDHFTAHERLPAAEVCDRARGAEDVVGPVARGAPQGFWDCSVVHLHPDRLLVVLLPVGARHRDGPARPCPGRSSQGGPDPSADDHVGRELHRRAQRTMATGPNRLTSSCVRKSAMGWNSRGAGLPIPAVVDESGEAARSPTTSVTAAAAAEIVSASVTSMMSGVSVAGVCLCNASPSTSRRTPAKTWNPFPRQMQRRCGADAGRRARDDDEAAILLLSAHRLNLRSLPTVVGSWPRGHDEGPRGRRAGIAARGPPRWRDVSAMRAWSGAAFGHLLLGVGQRAPDGLASMVFLSTAGPRVPRGR